MKTNQCRAGKVICPRDNRHCMQCVPDASPLQKGLIFLILCLLLLAGMLSSCSQTPYWHVTQHDGLQKVSYMKKGWPYNDHKCNYAPTTPVKRSTWAKQHYWRKR